METNTDGTTTNNSLPILVRAELELLLADYAFGELDASNATRFEASIGAYPDLQEELALITDSFAELDKEFQAIDRVNAQRLKNLTVHVQNRLAKENERKAHRWRLMKFFVPALATCAVIAVVSMPRGFTDYVFRRTVSANTDNALIFQPEEIKGLEDNQAVAAGLLDADASLSDKVLSSVMEKELTAQENKMATKMLRKETLKALAQNKSAFRGYFDNSAEMLDVTDEDVASVAAALTEM
jgi:hypothetical protein